MAQASASGVYPNQDSNIPGQNQIRNDKLKSPMYRDWPAKFTLGWYTSRICTTHLHPPEWMRKCRNRLWENSFMPMHLVAVRRDRGRIPLEAKSARTDSTEGAHDVSAMKVMTGRKASTNQKHSPSTSVCELIPEERGGASCAQRPTTRRHNCMIAGNATCVVIR